MTSESEMCNQVVSADDTSNERPFPSDRTLRAISRVGQSVNIAVERFVTVGEAIADDSSDTIRPLMYTACTEARVAGTAIEKLCDPPGEELCGGALGIPRAVSDRAAMIRTSRNLLAGVTRVLLLADSVIVKQFLLSSDKIQMSVTRMISVTNFTEFVKSFSQFGLEMMELAFLTGDKEVGLNDERRRAQMAAARLVLQRSAIVLLKSAKTCLNHPESSSARENRDTVFCQMRRAMDLIHYVVKECVKDSSASLVKVPSFTQLRRQSKEDVWESNHTLGSSLCSFLDQVEVTKMTSVGPQARQDLPASLEFILERIQDFTDSAYTTHEHRENILLLCDRVRLELNQLLRAGLIRQQQQQLLEQKDSPSGELDQALDDTLNSIRELRAQLQNTAILQASDVIKSARDAAELVAVLRNAALTTDSDRLEDVSDSFAEHLEHAQEVCRLLRHISPTVPLHVRAKYTEINLRIYGPQLAVAARTLCSNPTSKIAKENLEIFVEMWKLLMEDVQNLSNEVTETCENGAVQDKQVYTSLPRPGKHGMTQKPLKAVKLDSEEQAKIAESGLEMKMLTSDLEAETEKWGQQPDGNNGNNDIVNRAKAMSNMAYNMYQFTKGEGALKTTQDLFTQAEYFAEEANQFYKVVKQFSYTVPTSTDKKTLLEKVDEVPTRVQQLQFNVKTPTVGKAATFTKVDSVIQETKNLMNVISKVVTNCFECASKYKLDFRGLSPRGRSSPHRVDSEELGGGSGGGDSKGGGGTSSDGSM